MGKLSHIPFTRERFIRKSETFHEIDSPSYHPFQIHQFEIARPADTWTFIPHYHRELEVVVTRNVTGKLVCNGNTFPIGDGVVLTVPGGAIHNFSLQTPDRGKVFVLQVDEERTDSPFLKEGKRAGLACQTIINSRYKEELSREILSLVVARSGENGIGDAAYSKDLGDLSSIYRILSLIRKQKNSRSEKPMPPGGPIRNVIDFLGENYDRKLSLDAIASACSVSKYHLCRQFKEFTAMTITEYRNLLRIENAKRLLEEEFCTITEIAFRCGFDNVSYFTQLFSDLCGITPGQWRKSVMHR